MQIFQDYTPALFNKVLGYTAKNLATLNPFMVAAPRAIDLLAKIGKQIARYKSEEEALRHALTAAYASSFLDALKKYHIYLDVPDEKLEQLKTTLQKTYLSNIKAIELKAFDLQRFEENGLMQGFRHYFDHLLEDGKASQQARILVHNYVRDYAKINFMRILENETLAHEILIRRLNSKSHTLLVQQHYKEKYQTDLQHLYRSIVLNDDKGLTLQDIYIEPTFSVDEICWKKDDRYHHFPPSLHDYIYDVLQGKQSITELDVAQPQLTLILGSPGQGKTSFCYRLLYDTLNKQQNQSLPQPIYFIKFKELYKEHLAQLTTNPLAAFVDFLTEEYQLELKIRDLRNAILVLDGLDELKMKENLQASDIEKICQSLLDETERHSLQIIITARHGYIEEKTFAKKDVLILHLTPFDEDRQQNWLKKYRQFHPEAPLDATLLSRINENEELEYLKELTSQPILLHMVATLPDLQTLIAEKRNRAYVYDKLIEDVVQRRWDRAKNAKNSQLADLRHLEAADLRECLQDIAFAIFKQKQDHLHKQEVLALESIQTHFEVAKGEEEKAFKLLMISFYLKKCHTQQQRIGENYAIEFLHKSLSEYLAAEKIWREITYQFTRTVTNRRGKEVYAITEDQQALEMLNLIFAHRRLTKEVTHYLIEIIQNDDNTAQKEKLGERLSSFMAYCLEKDFLYSYQSDQQDSPIDIVLHVFYGYWTVCSHLGLQKNLIPDVQECRDRFAYLLYCLLKKEYDYINLSYQNLEKVNLCNANLQGINLQNANLSGAYLKNINFNKAYLNHVTFNKAKLNEVNLRYAYLSDADLRGADLSHADLYRTTLSKSNFRGANLSNSNLSGAYLRDAIFNGANLDGVILSGAVLNDSDICDTNLSGANLRSTIFSGAKLNNIIFNYADLCGAVFRGTNLRGAVFSGANLNKVIFNYADLCCTIFNNIKYKNKPTLIQQLSKAKTLKGCKGLPEDVETALRTQHPHLFH